MSHRVQQAESLMHRAIAQILERGLADPRVAGMVGVTRVKVTPDLRRADVFVTVMPEKYEKRTLAGLRAAATHIHGRVKKLVALRTVPHLQFELDHSVKKQDAVARAIEQAMARTEARSATDQTADPGDVAGGEGHNEGPIGKHPRG